jgi:hypothetical protein
MAAPTLTTVTPNQGPTVGGTNVTIIGTNLIPTSTVKFGATSATSFSAISSTQINAVAPSGTGTVQVVVTTIGGTSNGLPYTYVAAPAITSLSPNQGPTAGGTSVTITGTNLTLATTVKFGAASATGFTVLSDTQIVAVAPPSTGTVQVTVVTPGGTSNGLAYTYVAAPTVTGLSPSQGPTAGGTSVTITGTNLSLVTAVKFGAVSAAFTLVSGTQITAVAPSSAAGPVSVTVTAPGGTSGPGPYFYYVSAPAITALDPALGPVGGGNTVMLAGANLTLATTVKFGATNATFTVVSDAQINAVAPSGTGTVQVTVATPGGTSAGASYAYIAVPTVTGLNPNQGPTAGGTSVIVTGTALTLAGTVKFGAATAIAFTVLSDTQIVAVAPLGTGTVQVTVTTPGGTSTGASYTYVPPPSA